MHRSQAALLIAIFVIAIVLGSLWFFGNNFHVTGISTTPTQEEDSSVLPEGWEVVVVGELIIAHPGTPWTVGVPSEGELFVLEQPGEVVPKARITISSIPASDSFEDTIMEDVTYSPSGNKPDGIADFDLLTVGGRTWYVTQIELFEGQSTRAYYLKRSETEALKVTLFESDISDWMDSSFRPGRTEAARTLEDLITFLGI